VVPYLLIVSDYKLFLRLSTGKTLCEYAEVDSISSKRSRTPECAWQNLQVWKDDTGARTIMFYGSGGKEQQFLEFDSKDPILFPRLVADGLPALN
jgi:hypothetical protein